MKTIMYYFTGTGNSLAAAKKIAAALVNCELVPIASLQETAGDIVPQADRVGILCPVYFTGLPAMVASFAGRLDLSRSRYVFSVLTYGGSGGESALAQLDGILRQKSGRGLSAGWIVKMPGNYILMYEPPTGKKRERILATATEEIRKIGVDIAACRVQALPRSLISRLLHSLMYWRFISGARGSDRKFSVNDRCTACGTCAAICPAKNIELADKKPVWNHHCELCCGCIHLCPAGAIQAGKRTEEWARYQNPEIRLPELKAQRGSE